MKASPAAIFDYDGTLTQERGIKTIDPKLKQLLAELSLEHKFAICSGRPIEFVIPKITDICQQSANPKLAQANWYLVCDNGASGYYFDSKTNQYQVDYQIPWPYPQEHLQQLYQELIDLIGNQAVSYDLNPQLLIFRSIPSEDLPEWDQRTIDLIAQATPVIKRHDPDNCLRIVNSGIAMLIINKAADKDLGLQKFGRFLQNQHPEISFSSNFSEIYAIGDRPQPGGNDHHFLSGKWGTPYSVGELDPQNSHLKTIHQNQQLLTGSNGTIAILKKHFL